MENASKALLIAGGILIAMLILSIGTYLFMTYGQLGQTYEQNLTAGEIKKFNSNFTKFEGRTDITAQEIVTLYKFVKAYNQKNEASIATIEVKNAIGSNIPNSSNMALTEADLVKFIENNSNDSTNNNNIIYFECTKLEYNPDTGMIYEIEFTH